MLFNSYLKFLIIYTYKKKKNQIAFLNSIIIIKVIYVL